MKYWFKPYRFWRWFAAYYPVSWQGWVVVIGALSALVKGFLWSDWNSPSLGDTLLWFIPLVILVLAVFDIITRIKGEYPWWWREWKEKRRSQNKES